MSVSSGFFTSESVSDGHPDKFCDQISDSVLDACLAVDPVSRIAVESAAKGGKVWVFGEITTRANPDVPEIVRDVVRAIGHVDGRWGLDPEKLRIDVDISMQSPEISSKVDTGGAGDQGLMFGYACDETPELMPAPIAWAHALMREHKRFRSTEEGESLGPDAKSQVTVEYRDGRPTRIQTVVLSSQHAPHISQNALRELVVERIIRKALPQALTDNATIHVNPGGPFVEGGPTVDAGLTGRKIIVDTYGGYARHGGGAFSGKDPTKVDRSAAYAARQLAREVVGSGLARHCEVRLAYAIGVAEPVAIGIETFGTEANGGRSIESLAVPALFTPAAIIARLGLRNPIYRQTSTFGHFGRTGLPWENSMKLAGSAT